MRKKVIAIHAPLYQAIAQLTERQQEMVRMVYFEGMSQDEVAKHFGITKAAVSNAMPDQQKRGLNQRIVK